MNTYTAASNPNSIPPTSLVALTRSLWANRQLISQMTKREIVGRYRGSIIGLAWSFLNPVLMLIIYTFVFSVVFKARWGIGVEDSKVDFAIVLFVGLIVHGIFADCINRSPGLILSNVNFVKKVVFPLEILPWVGIGSALFHAMVSIAMMLTTIFIFKSTLYWTILFFPVVILPLLFTTAGFSFFISATGVYVRDISQLTGIFTSILLFLSPIFYPISALPEKYRKHIYISPLTFIIEELRKVLLWGKLPDMVGLVLYLFLSLAVLWMGFWWFQRTRKGFADVI